MRLFSSDRFPVPLPERHPFPMAKYRLLRERLEADPRGRYVVETAPAAGDDELARAHDPSYLAAVVAGAVPEAAWRRVGFPWSPELVERTRRSAGGTIAACRAALETGSAANLAGGTHHAFPDRGGGFCVVNDAAVAIRAMQAEGRVRRAAVVDCDVHQGDGTAAIFHGDDAVFTFSIHGARNYPFRKQRSDLDVALADGTRDLEYLDRLGGALPTVWDRARPDLVIYLAGADPYRDDRYGRMALSAEGLAERDRMVLERCRSSGVATAVVMAGGYARDLDDIAAIHARTVEILFDVAPST